ncbi:Putative E3 ubiquitin-protein ligase RF298 [Linum perenne]
MAPMVAKANISCGSQMASPQPKGSRNKRKFRADPPSDDAEKSIPSAQSECYEFCAEKFEAMVGHGLASACDLCGITQGHSDDLKLDLGLSTAVGSSEVEPSQPKEELVPEESLDADWSDLTESQLEELVLNNLDAIFRSAIKKIVGSGYTEEAATKAVLRSSICYGSKDTGANIVDNALAFLHNGQETDPSKDHSFEDLQQLEKYVLAEFVCVLREVKPFFSTGDAMWCLLICDMNVTHACAMDSNLMSSFPADESSNGDSTTDSQPQTKPESEGPESNVTAPCKPVPSVPSARNPQSETTNSISGVARITKSMKSGTLHGLVSVKEGSTSAFDPVDKPFSIAGPSKSIVLEEKFTVSRKVHSGSTKREFILRQKTLHLEKSYRTYGSKGSLRSGKLSGLGNLIFEKKPKSVSDSTAANVKNASARLSKATVVDSPQDGANQSLPSNSGPSPSSVSFVLETPSSVSSSPNPNVTPALPPANASSSALPPAKASPALPPVSAAPALSMADTELSLSLPTKSNPSLVPASSVSQATVYSFAGMPSDKPMMPWFPRDKKDEMIVKLLPRVRKLKNQLQEWTEWANQKVMQAARRLGKDKAELKLLRQEKEEVERLKKEKLSLEENTMKKLTEMENALSKAGGQVERANAAVRRLEVENAALRKETEAAKLRADESAASCEEVSKREKNTLMKVQSWEKQKGLLQEELVIEKRKASQLLQDLDVAKQRQEQQEARWQQEEKAKEDLLQQASALRKERENIDASTKSKEEAIKSKAEINLQKYKNDIQKLENEISQIRLKVDSSKIAALRMGVDAADVKSNNQAWSSYVSQVFADNISNDEELKRERECVMCLSEEMSVVFLPCAHQVVCTNCNELHEKQGMKDCPSCRCPIKRRVPVRSARSSSS